ncbi:MAG: prolipoprotein diacylglyceryl transferase [Dehalococcoidales bacterium]|nr:prolipoprotein diacylglyceryl transferase [Dehalococcoidales bacterium]
MITVNIDPILIHIGPLTIRWYGLMYVVGIIVGLLVVQPYAKAKGLTTDILETIVPWAVLAGLVGARLYFVVQQPLGQYLSQPWRIIAFWEGGMAFYGAIFGVLLVLVIASRLLKFPLLTLLDVAGLFGAVGQFFGRIGNIINGDIIGYPTTLPWGFVYANPNSFAPRHDIAYQPAALYEAVINVVLFGILWRLRNKFKPGVLFFVYLIGYSITQIIVFFWRDNEVVFLGLKQAQVTAIGVIIAAVVVFFAVAVSRRKKGIQDTKQA